MAESRPNLYKRVELKVQLTYEEDVLELSHVVNALGEELSLHLVDDLVHTVSPVGHDRSVCREILPKSSVVFQRRCLFVLINIPPSHKFQSQLGVWGFGLWIGIGD